MTTKFPEIWLDEDLVLALETQVLDDFITAVGIFNGNKEKITSLIEMCEGELGGAETWQEVFTLETILNYLDIELEECE